MQLSSERVNWLNAGLMVASAVAAFIAPFHLFVFAYAVLGPLHYLTEISWLHDRDYFYPRRGRRLWLGLVTLTMAVLIYGFVQNDLLHRSVGPALEVGMVYLAFATALLLPLIDRALTGVAVVVAVAIAIAWFSNVEAYFIIAYFLITIIHVLIFTAAFVLYGALKSKSRGALVSLGVMIACVASFFVYNPQGMLPPEGLRILYTRFVILNDQLLQLFGYTGLKIYEAPPAIAVMRLIAFAYTYHYLNWFSKTKIIGWHAISKKRAFAICALWVTFVAVYVINYELGFALLYLLSLLHVLLEFPLDHKTFAGIAKELRAHRPAQA